MNWQGITQYDLYREGIRLARRFLEVNQIPEPIFLTYREAEEIYPHVCKEKSVRRLALEIWKRTAKGPKLGTGTGLYTHGYVFVSLERAAKPQVTPRNRSWSWPCYKVDRTPVGVVAHEVGHYVGEHLRQKMNKIVAHNTRNIWGTIVCQKIKPITGYEPTVDEAGAETSRLFILNPDLLHQGNGERYRFFTHHLGLIPSETRTWKEVLDHPEYIRAAQSWINRPYHEPRTKFKPTLLVR